MFRSLLTLALAAFALSASAQDNLVAAPASADAKVAAAPSPSGYRRLAKKAKRLSRREEKAAAALAKREAAAAAAAAKADAAAVAVKEEAPAKAWGGRTVASRRDTEDIVYAGPGMGVKPRLSKEMVPYSVVPPRKKAAGTTLSGE